MRPSTAFLLFSGLSIGLLGVSFLDAAVRGDRQAFRLEQTRQQVAQLELTDLSLFTEARYTRHLSQADLHTAFQDHPLALEHFPTGALILPPANLQRVNEPVDTETAISD